MEIGKEVETHRVTPVRTTTPQRERRFEPARPVEPVKDPEKAPTKVPSK